jgi:hypothetical protein
MISTNKTKHKCLRIEGTSRARKSHEKTKKRHENHSSQEEEIDATKNAFIHSEVRFSTKWFKKSSLKSRAMEKAIRMDELP